MGSSSVELLFAGFLAQCESEGALDFEAWVQGHAEQEAELRALRALHSEARGALGQLPAPPAGRGESYFYRSGKRTPRMVSGELHILPVQHQLGDTIGDFHLVRRIDAGGQGEVWEAEELSLRRRVALKLVLPARVNEHNLALFAREARAGGRLTHPGIVTVYAHGESDGVHWIAQELVETGWTLRHFIEEMRDERQLPAGYYTRVAEFMQQLADALQAAHDAGVIHRDIKPQNVLISSDDKPKLSDFGLARITDEAELSQSGYLAGTYLYMSPEQVAARRTGIDSRTDIFSLGIVLYEMLALRRPFEGDTSHQIADKILTWDPPDLRKLRSQIPLELAVICGKMLEKRREDRFQSMDEVAAELRRFLRDEPLLTKPDGLARRVRKWTRRHPTASAASSVTAVALVLVTWLVATNISTSHARDLAERDKLYSNAVWAIEMDNVDSAILLIDKAIALDPGDPMGHLILSQGLRKYLRNTEAMEQMELARTKGFVEDSDLLETAYDHANYGYALFGSREQPRYPEAEEHLVRALELDPNLYPLYISLYQLRMGLGKPVEALAALDAYQARVGSGELYYTVVEALKHGVQLEYARAIEIMEALWEREGIDRDHLRRLGYHRIVGRYLKELDELERAEHHLNLAVEEGPDDAPSWAGLAVVFLKRYQREKLDPSSRHEELVGFLDAAERCAARSVEIMAFKPDYHAIRAQVAIELLVLAPVSGELDANEDYVRAGECLAELRRLAPNHPGISFLNSRYLAASGPYYSARGEYRAAVDLFEDAVLENPENYQALVLMAQSRWFLGEYRNALNDLQRALEIWDAPTNAGHFSQEWLQAILVWSFGSAIELDGEEELAEESSARYLELLEMGAKPASEELLSFAEFLATAPEELRDCSLSLDLIRDHDLHLAFLGTTDAEEAEQILKRIEEACELFN